MLEDGAVAITQYLAHRQSRVDEVLAALRDVGKVLGVPETALDRLSKLLVVLLTLLTPHQHPHQHPHRRRRGITRRSVQSLARRLLVWNG